MDTITIETYTLILKHEFEFPGAGKSEIDQPIVIKYASPVYEKLQHSNSVIINEMLRKLEHEVLYRLSKED